MVHLLPLVKYIYSAMRKYSHPKIFHILSCYDKFKCILLRLFVIDQHKVGHHFEVLITKLQGYQNYLQIQILKNAECTHPSLP